MEAYTQTFYADRHEKTVYSARTVLSILLERIPVVHSAVDVGCGVGTWLSVLREMGVEEIQGFDGSWVDRNLLAIPQASFTEIDLSRSTIRLSRRYDLAVSLEVAEHLAPDRAKEFVSSLTALSDNVLFSAAIPFQGGRNHVNEQWQRYWAGLFDAKGYAVHDFIRPRIWNDARIPFWYKQNIFLYSRRPASMSVPADPAAPHGCPMPLDLVHPDLFQMKAQAQSGVRNGFKIFRRSLKEWIAR